MLQTSRFRLDRNLGLVDHYGDDCRPPTCVRPSRPPAVAAIIVSGILVLAFDQVRPPFL